MSGAAQRLHASCVAVGPRAALITGPTGSGKSSLAIQLIAMGARLVSDDQTHVSTRDQKVIARPPETLAGLLEMRGIGLVKLDYQAQAEVVLVVDMSTGAADPSVPRLPQLRKTTLGYVAVPLIPGKNRPHLAYETMVCLRAGRESLFLDPEAPLEGVTDVGAQ